MGSDTRYRAFISYNHADEAWARRIHRDLETYPVPARLVGVETDVGPVPKRLTPIFRDQDELPAAADLSDAVQTALAQSDALLVICSPAAARSRWVNREIEVFRAVNPDGRILTAIVGGDPAASLSGSGADQSCFPDALLERDEAGVFSEPLAADFRSEGPGRRAATLKLVSGLLGLRLDDLVQRDLQRRQRRVTAITALSLSVSLVMAALTAFAMSAQSEAERRKAEAEDLIEFMLSELKDRLEPVGRLDVLDAVGEKIVEYYHNQPGGELGADDLGRRARAFHLLGRIDEDEGDIANAILRFREAFGATERSLAAAPNDAERIFDHSQSAFWVGQAALRQADLDTAEIHFEAYRDLADRLLEIDPANREWLLESAYSHTNLAVVYLRQRRVGPARDSAVRSLEAKLELAENFPDPVRGWLDIANSYAWIADIELEAGHRQQAIQWRQRQVEVFEDQLSDTIDDWEVREDAIEAELGLARSILIDASEVTRDELEFALAVLESAGVEARAMVTHDTSNANWILTATILRIWATDGFLIANDIDAARQAQREATAYLAQPTLVEGSFPQEIRYRRLALLAQARILLAAGQFEAAEEEARHLLDLILMDPGVTENVASVAYIYAATSNVLADALDGQGQADDATDIRRRFMAVLDRVSDRLSRRTVLEYRKAQQALPAVAAGAD